MFAAIGSGIGGLSGVRLSFLPELLSGKEKRTDQSGFEPLHSHESTVDYFSPHGWRESNPLIAELYLTELLIHIGKSG